MSKTRQRSTATAPKQTSLQIEFELWAAERKRKQSTPQRAVPCVQRAPPPTPVEEQNEPDMLLLLAELLDKEQEAEEEGDYQRQQFPKDLLCRLTTHTSLSEQWFDETPLLVE